MPPNVITESEVTILSTSGSSTQQEQQPVERSSSSSSIEDSSSSNNSPVVLLEEADNGVIHYVHCTSKFAYQVPDDKSAEEVNQTLNLNLGLKHVDPWNPKLRKTLRNVVDSFSWVETLLIAVWVRIPLRLRHEVVQMSWKIYFWFHKLFLGRSTGIHNDVSLEYHALTSILWWTRLLPATIERMRFALNQLQVHHPPSTSLNSQMIIIEQQQQQQDETKSSSSSSSSSCCGVYLSLRTNQNETTTTNRPKKVIFWIYGGAFLGGDIEGNIGIAERIGIDCNSDAVFLANYRLLPEHEFHDSCQDVYQAYQWLIHTGGVSPEHVILYGISSGGGLALSLLQRLVHENNHPSSLLLLPAGAVLMCPFVDYTEPQGSMLHYINHDLIVNQSVAETGFPYLEIKLGNAEDRKKASPVYGNLEGLPPLLVVVSEHECCYDQCILLVNRARESGVNCTLAIWQYMCHVWPILSPFIPEGKQAQTVICNWMKSVFAEKDE